MRVLLIDDSEVFRRTLADTLADLLGATVDQAENGPAALRRLDHEGDDIDLVLVDLRMPDMDGLEVSRRILSRRQPPRVIVVTAFDELTYSEEARRIGVDGFFCKTDGVQRLLAEIERVTA